MKQTDRKTFEVPARLDGVSTKSDGSAGLRFTTGLEMKPDEMMLLFEYVRTEGFLLFAMNQFQDTDTPKENAPSNEKSPAKRLRSVLFVYWKENVGNGDFEAFYKKKMESIIDSVKEKLPERA